MPALVNVTFVFDNNIQKLHFGSPTIGSVPPDITTSGTTTTFPPSEFICTVTLNDGYIIDNVSSSATISDIGNNTFKFTVIASTSPTITITSKKATSQVSIDLTTLSGWGNVADGQHQLTVQAKADNYRDSEKSTAVSFTKVVHSLKCQLH